MLTFMCSYIEITVVDHAHNLQQPNGGVTLSSYDKLACCETWCWTWTISNKATTWQTASDNVDGCFENRPTHLQLQLTGSQPRICSGSVTQDMRSLTGSIYCRLFHPVAVEPVVR